MAYTYAGQYGPEAVLDRNGALVKSTSITVYLADGTTAATLYTDYTKTTPLGTNIVSTDINGDLTFFASPALYVIKWSAGTSQLTVLVNIYPLEVQTISSTLTVTERPLDPRNYVPNGTTWAASPAASINAALNAARTSTETRTVLIPPGTMNLETSVGDPTILGTGSPSNSLGRNGQFYVDLGTLHKFGPKSSGVWPAWNGSSVGTDTTYRGLNLLGASRYSVSLKAAGDFDVLIGSWADSVISHLTFDANSSSAATFGCGVNAHLSQATLEHTQVKNWHGYAYRLNDQQTNTDTHQVGRLSVLRRNLCFEGSDPKTTGLLVGPGLTDSWVERNQLGGLFANMIVGSTGLRISGNYFYGNASPVWNVLLGYLDSSGASFFGDHCMFSENWFVNALRECLHMEVNVSKTVPTYAHLAIVGNNFQGFSSAANGRFPAVAIVGASNARRTHMVTITGNRFGSDPQAQGSPPGTSGVGSYYVDMCHVSQATVTGNTWEAATRGYPVRALASTLIESGANGGDDLSDPVTITSLSDLTAYLSGLGVNAFWIADNDTAANGASANGATDSAHGLTISPVASRAPTVKTAAHNVGAIGSNSWVFSNTNGAGPQAFSIASTSALQMTDGLCIVAVVKPASGTAPSARIVQKGATDNEYRFSYETGGASRFYSPAAFDETSPTSLFTNSVWQVVSWWSDGWTADIRLNGGLKGQAAGLGRTFPTSTDQLWIGCKPTSTTQSDGWAGEIAAVVVTTHAMSRTDRDAIDHAFATYYAITEA